MAGLFDSIFASPSDQALWALGSGLLGVRRGQEGRALMAPLVAFNEAQQSERRNKLTDSQLAMHELQMQQMRKAQEDADKLRGIYSDPSNFMRSPQAAFPPNEMDWQGSPAAPPVFDPRLLAENLLRSGTLAGAKEGMGMLTKDEAPMVVGDSLVTRAGKELYRAPVKPAPTPADLQKYLFAVQQGYKGTLEQWEKETRAAGASRVTVDSRQETAEAKTVGEYWGKQYGKIQEDGFAASSKMARLDRMSALLDGVDTGKLTPTGTEVAAYLKSVGLDIDPKLDNKQAAQALSRELAMQARNPSGGAGMPGAMSDADREFLVSTVPGLANTPGGNRLMIETSRRLAKRDADVARLASQYRLKNRQLDEGFVEELRRFADANPLFADLSSGTPVVPFYDKTGRRVR